LIKEEDKNKRESFPQLEKKSKRGLNEIREETALTPLRKRGLLTCPMDPKVECARE